MLLSSSEKPCCEKKKSAKIKLTIYILEWGFLTRPWWGGGDIDNVWRHFGCHHSGVAPGTC